MRAHAWQAMTAYRGLGKSLSTLSLIAKNPAKAQFMQTGGVKTTLLVCPMSTLSTWKEQVETHAPEMKVSFNCFLW